MGEICFAKITKFAAWFAFFLLICVLFSLVVTSFPSLHAFGFGFLTSSQWDPVNNQFGALSAIVGTLVTSLIALFLGGPISVGIAVFLSQISPLKIGRLIRTPIDLMAGIPSIIYGMWGLMVLVPFLSDFVQPQLTSFFSGVPVLHRLFDGPPIGIGVFAAGLILAIMIIPYVSSTLLEMMNTVPSALKEAAYGLGATRFEVVRKVILPYIKEGLIGSLMLGLGRALGETMAVTFVIGNSKELITSLFSPGNTISSSIANEFNEATNPLYSAALLELGLILFVISFLVLAFSRLFLSRKKYSV